MYSNQGRFFIERILVSDLGLAFVHHRHSGKCPWNICHPRLQLHSLSHTTPISKGRQDPNRVLQPSFGLVGTVFSRNPASPGCHLSIPLELLARFEFYRDLRYNILTCATTVLLQHTARTVQYWVPIGATLPPLRPCPNHGIRPNSFSSSSGVIHRHPS